MKLTGTFLMVICIVIVSLESTSALPQSDSFIISDVSSAQSQYNTVEHVSKTETKFSLPAFKFVPSHISANSYNLSYEENEQDGEEVTVGLQGGKYGLGFAATFPAYGVSGTYQFNEKITAEAILGFFGVISNYSVRGWYRFHRNLKYDVYGYGSLSLLQYRYRTFTQNRRNTESVPGFGAGVGLEWGIQELLSDDSLPPLFFNFEFGLVLANFEHYNFSSMVFGSGIHYRFGN